MTDLTQISGILASTFTGIALLPQLFRIIKDKKPASTPALTLIALFIGLVFWVIYGVLKNDWIIIISNGFSLLVNILIGTLSLYYHRYNKDLAKALVGKM